MGQQLVKVTHKNIRIAPSKAQRVCRLIHRKPLSEAYQILNSIDQRKMVKLLLKLLLEASANAVNNYAMRGDDLRVEECVANKGPLLKRSFIRAKGRTDLRVHKTSHLSVVLREGEQAKRPKTVKGAKIKAGEELSTKKIEEKLGD
ncbi:50S ribosomal protein L22 [Candidatus Mycoplasma haematolamae str. Purdue]|uniref:50S ribosomal protein L22 n=1 Tax=Mycoplasma haematolamae (strain Purdue) TaxID=1212765 RepID=I7BJW1_MYCHA|nr:uL22 family ribosomal protein [Candidatus Mycoplasma haematolamae]AFO52153.1 50S ribosomal protein L22 [Candidatus Mycoplasma haematolamae str. Purdue]